MTKFTEYHDLQRETWETEKAIISKLIPRIDKSVNASIQSAAHAVASFYRIDPDSTEFQEILIEARTFYVGKYCQLLGTVGEHYLDDLKSRANMSLAALEAVRLDHILMANKP